MKVASLSSTIATFLTAFAVGMTAYPLASAVLTKTRDGMPDGLLTPYQYYLVLNLLGNGGIIEKAQQLSSPSDFDSSRALIFATDTWLHFKTKPFEFVQIEPLQRDTVTYGRVLSSNCTNQDNTYDDQLRKECTFSPSIRSGYFLVPITALEVFNNISATTSVNVYDGISPSQAFLGVPGNGVPQQRDFVATTFSVATQCKPATGDCNISRDNITGGAGSSFHCQKYSAWWGMVSGPPSYFKKQYFTDSTGTKNASGTAAKVSNPFYVGINGMTNPASGAAIPLTKNKDQGVISQEYGGISYLFFCTATVYEVKYTALNGSITQFTANPSNSSVATALMSADSSLNAGDLQLRAAADLGALVANNSQEMADIFALEYSRGRLAKSSRLGSAERYKQPLPCPLPGSTVLLRTVSGALQLSPVLEAQQRTSTIVARVPTAPLYSLIASILLLIAFGIFLTTAALIAARTADVEEVRTRLSLQHLVAERMEPQKACMPVENLDDEFKENVMSGLTKRIGIGKRDQVAGGWELKIWEPMKQ
ncbi:MAG: hypothetical protein M1813_007754 [Trichoglossum hirsutum]|nr:MAG: hypothetical protein M1813_007754 [Trichoglossum hirsutum]